MKISKALSIMLMVVAAFSIACSSVVKPLSFADSPIEQKADLVSLLPPSDVVIKVNSKRLFNDSIPQILSFVPEQAAKFDAEMERLRNESGVDPRAFDQVVIGMTYKSGKPTNANDVDFVGLARGSFDAAALLEAGKKSAQGQSREETVGDKTVYIYSSPAASSNRNESDKKNVAENSVADNLKVDEVAVVSLDSNTIAFAKPAQIRSLLTSSDNTSANPKLAELLSRNPNAALNFAMNSSFYENMTASGLAKNRAAEAPKMREALVSLDLDNNRFLLNFTAIAPQEEDAKKLEQSFTMMQSMAKQMLDGASADTKETLVRTIDNFKITRNATEVQFQASVPKNDFEQIAKGYAALIGSMVTAGVSQSKGATANSFSVPPINKSSSINR